jgi:hypothetical protein
MKTSLAVFGLLLAPSLLFAESIRCGSQLIEKGSTSADLLEYCGKPAQIVNNGTVTGLTGNTHTSEGHHQPGDWRLSSRNVDVRFWAQPAHGTGTHRERHRGSNRVVGLRPQSAVRLRNARLAGEVYDQNILATRVQ